MRQLFLLVTNISHFTKYLRELYFAVTNKIFWEGFLESVKNSWSLIGIFLVVTIKDRSVAYLTKHQLRGQFLSNQTPIMQSYSRITSSFNKCQANQLWSPARLFHEPIFLELIKERIAICCCTGPLWLRNNSNGPKKFPKKKKKKTRLM